jgi:hypothetical protein
MEFTDLGLRFTIAYDDLSDVWPRVQKVRCAQLTPSSMCSQSHSTTLAVCTQALEAHLPLRNVSLHSTLGGSVVVEELPIQYVAQKQSYQPPP